jgi:hypothetical protein
MGTGPPEFHWRRGFVHVHVCTSVREGLAVRYGVQLCHNRSPEAGVGERISEDLQGVQRVLRGEKLRRGGHECWGRVILLDCDTIFRQL